MRHSTTRSLYRYWNEVRGARLAPRRFEIEPSRIADLLPEAFILECAEEDTVRFRLAGTRLTSQFGCELRGSSFASLWSGQDLAEVSRKLATVKESGAAAVFISEGACQRGRTALFEIVVLPLIHSQGEIDRMLGAASCANPPEWLGNEPMVRHRLVQSRTIVPETSMPEILAARRSFETTVVDASTQPPFFPLTRAARIVRQDQRQFRVYEGGLSTRAMDF